ncbi:MAG: hypothetical protein ABSD43_03410 [Terracidiphilus sp.]
MAKTKSHELPRIPGAVLLVEGYLPDRILLTSANKTLMLQYWNDSHAFPSISVDGSIVAAPSLVAGETAELSCCTVSTYCLKEGKWTEHSELNPEHGTIEGTVAISPDGSMLASVTRNPQLHAYDRPQFRLRVLDLRTGKVKVISESPDLPFGLSWSPDSHHLAFDMEPPGHSPLSSVRAIYTANLDSGEISRIGLGMAPSWSPSGEWIAYVGYIEESDRHQSSDFYAGRYYSVGDNQVRLMSPVGTHPRILMDFHSDVVPNLQPVWSPDSRTILFNKSRNPDWDTFDIYAVDIHTGKATRKFKNVAPVYGWAVEK